MNDKQLLALIGRVDVEMPGVPLAGLLRDHVRVGDYQARLLAIARAVQAAERERWAPLVAELLSTELGELACAGSHAPVENILGRLQDVLGPNTEGQRAA
jgi:hypothetical protein